MKPMSVAMLLGAALLAAPAMAGEADVVGVEMRPAGAAGAWHLEVTVRHADEGWDHYSDKWDVVAPDGIVLGTRVLYHPHVDEQPFTRGHTVPIPPGIDKVTVRAHDKEHGYGGAELTVKIAR